MCLGDLSLAGNSQQSEEHNHGTTASSEPEGPSNAVAVADERGTEQGSGP